jgi:hypothetical protein
LGLSENREKVLGNEIGNREKVLGPSLELVEGAQDLSVLIKEHTGRWYYWST